MVVIFKLVFLSLNFRKPASSSSSSFFFSYAINKKFWEFFFFPFCAYVLAFGNEISFKIVVDVIVYETPMIILMSTLTINIIYIYILIILAHDLWPKLLKNTFFLSF
jgi:hypothetical protein